jgi:hypothetical protein
MAIPETIQNLAQRWRLESVDPEVDLVIEGQYPASDGYRFEATPNTSASSSPGSDTPSTQWVSGGGRPGFRPVSFASVFHGDHNLDDRPAKRWEALQRMQERDPTLGRAPRVRLTFGRNSVVGWLKVDGKIQGYWISGLVRAVTFTIRIEPAPRVAVDTVDPRAGETQYLSLAAGETFEELGRRYYGDPLRGEMIRRVNAAALGSGGQAPEVGARIKVLEREHPAVTGPIFPRAAAFAEQDGDGSAWKARVRAMAEERGTAIRGLPWRLLPEIITGEV